MLPRDQQFSNHHAPLVQKLTQYEMRFATVRFQRKNHKPDVHCNNEYGYKKVGVPITNKQRQNGRAKHTY